MDARRARGFVIGVTMAWSLTSPAAAQTPYPGSRDLGFGEDGIVTTPIGTNESVNDIVVDDRGRIVVAGYSADSDVDSHFAVVRYLPDGRLDPDFDDDGIVTTPIGSGHDIAEALAIQPDGKIVVAGWNEEWPRYNFVVVRYHPDGSLDTGFGDTGKVVDFSVANHAVAHDLALQPDGKILLAGYAVSATTGYDPCVVRYHPSGARDLSFGVNGSGTAV
jgi:uncharacterized delta-60 repeat protein